MQIVKGVMVASRFMIHAYKVVATSILLYYLIKETTARELHGRKRTGTSGADSQRDG